MPTETETRNQPLRLQGLYGVLFLGMFGLLLVLPRPMAFGLLMATSLISLVVVIRYPQHTVRRLVQAIRGAVRTVGPTRRESYRLYSLLAVAVATILLLPVHEERYWLLGVVLLLVTPVLLAATLPPLDSTADDGPAYTVSPTRWWHGAAACTGLLLLVLLTWLSIPVKRPIDVSFLNTHMQHGLFIAALAALIYGFSGGHARILRPNRAALLIVAATVLALGLRLWQLGTALPFLIDEWLYTTAIVYMDYGDYTAPLMNRVSSYISATYLYTYWSTVLSGVAGDGFVGLRMGSVVLGTLTVAAAGALGYEAARMSRQNQAQAATIGALSAILVATLPAHIHYSRIALLTIAAPMVATAAAALTLRALRCNHRGVYVLAGAAVGLTQYFNEAGRLLMPPVFAFWVMALIAGGQLPTLRARWRGILLAVMLAVLVGCVPWAVNALSNEPVLTRFDANSNMLHSNATLYDRVTLVRNSMRGAVTTLTSRPDPTYFFGGPQPFIPVWMLAPFLLGVAAMAARWRNPANLLLLMWIILTILGNSLLLQTSTPRYVIMAPVASVATVLGLYTLLRYTIQERFVRISAIGLIAVLSVVNVSYYFRVSIPHLERDIHNALMSEGLYAPEYVLRTLRHYTPDGAHVHIIHHFHRQPVLVAVSQFIDKSRVSLIDTDEDDLAYRMQNLSSDWRHVVFVSPEDDASLAQLRAMYTLDGPYFIDDDTPNAIRMMMYIIVDD